MLFCVLVLVRVENRKVLPNNFAGAIPLDALGPRIPCPDIAIGIKHVDRVVGHGLDEHIQLAFSIRDVLRELQFAWTRHANTPHTHKRAVYRHPFVSLNESSYSCAEDDGTYGLPR